MTFEQSNQFLFTKHFPVRHVSATPRTSAIRDSVLRSILPTPQKRLNIGELINFKGEYGHLLPTFRNYVERQIIAISQIDDNEARKYALSLFVEDAKIQMGDLAEAMKINWGKITFGSLLPIVGAGLSVLSSNGAYAIAGAVTGLTTAIYNTVTGIPEDRRAPLNSPLAYVAHAQRKFI